MQNEQAPPKSCKEGEEITAVTYSNRKESQISIDTRRHEFKKLPNNTSV